MRLSEYLDANNLKPATFAGRINVPASTIKRLLEGQRSPGLELLKKIMAATDGAVTPNDFLDLPKSERAA